jgi:hypothetical protein
MKPINTFCGLNAKLLTVKVGDANSYLCAVPLGNIEFYVGLRDVLKSLFILK